MINQEEEQNLSIEGLSASTEILELIKNLGNKDGILRVKSRNKLVSIGASAVPILEKALTDKNQWCRWEAAKALGEIASPEATGALINSLEDKSFDVRWLAAEDLVAIGSAVVVPMLKVLVNKSDSIWIREGAHHIFHGLIKRNKFSQTLRPVLAALEDIYDSYSMTFAAEKALNSMESIGQKSES